MKKIFLSLSFFVIASSSLLSIIWLLGYRYNDFQIKSNNLALRLGERTPIWINTILLNSKNKISSYITKQVKIFDKNIYYSKMNELIIKIQKKYPFISQIIISNDKSSLLTKKKSQNKLIQRYTFFLDSKNKISIVYNISRLIKYINNLYCSKIDQDKQKILTAYYLDSKMIFMNNNLKNHQRYQLINSQINLQHTKLIHLKISNVNLYQMKIHNKYIQNITLFLGIQKSYFILSKSEIIILLIFIFFICLFFYFGIRYTYFSLSRAKKNVPMREYPVLENLFNELNQQAQMSIAKEGWEKSIKNFKEIDTTIFIQYNSFDKNYTMKSVNQYNHFHQFLLSEEDFILSKIHKPSKPFFITKNAFHTTPVKKIINYYNENIQYCESLLFIPLDNQHFIIHLFKEIQDIKLIESIFVYTLNKE